MSLEPIVFLVDDDPAVLRSLTALVKATFARVQAFASAGEFLAAYDPDQPGCLVLDVAMPQMNGLELQRKLAQDKIELPIVFITGHGNVPMAVEAVQAGAVSFLEKPFPEQALWHGIRKALELDAQNRRRRLRRCRTEEMLGRLTAGERAVLDLVLQGKTNKEVATVLKLSVRTVEDRRAKLMKKTQASSVAELVQTVVAR